MKKKSVKHISFLVAVALAFINCQCPSPNTSSEGINKEFEGSSIVFIGDVIELNPEEMTYKIKVKEIFKGKLIINQVLIGKNDPYCSPYIGRKGDWLIFGNVDDFIRANSCGMSFQIDEPKIFAPPPPPQESEANEISEEKIMEWKKECKVGSLKIINYLRSKRIGR